MKVKIHILLWVLLALGGQLSAQFKVDNSNPNPIEIIRNNLIGEGVEILSIEFDGGDQSIGAFSEGKNTGGHPEGLGIDNGLLITTGAAEEAMQGAGNGTQGEDLNSKVGNGYLVSGHPTLTQLAPENSIISDFSIIKIEFIPETDTFRLNYVWASEEYPIFVCSEFNDVFGFILSGPGISGAFNNGSGKNIAIIPGTQLPVTINNLNNGMVMDNEFTNPSNCAQEALNGETAQFFIDNLKHGTNAKPAYNGYTTLLEAKSAVIPCETYTIELIIADIGNYLQDSGVFFEKGSFRTSTTEVSVYSPNEDNTISEGCVSANIEIDANTKFNTTLPLNAEIKGSATLGVDYRLMLNGTEISNATDIVLPANETILNIEIEAINDNISEGTEDVIITYKKSLFINPLSQCPEKRDSVILYIKDNKLEAKDLPDTLSLCGNGSKELDATITTSIKEGNKFGNATSTDILPENTEFVSTIQVSNEEQNAVSKNAYPVICINVEHRNPKDLNIFIESPNGQVMELATGVGKDFEPNFTETCFIASAETPIGEGTSPFTGGFLPEGNFEDLIGATINGEWKLKITDTQTGIMGTLVSWSIEFTNPYKVDYFWTPNADISSTTSSVVQVSPTSSTLYNVTIEDIYKCSIKDSTFINLVEGYSFSVDTTHVKCYGENNGSIALSSADNSLTYSWLDNALGSKRENLTAGDYTVTIIGASGCEQQEVYTIRQPEELIVTSDIMGSSCAGKQDGRITVIPSGGTSPYNITWNEVSSTELMLDQLAAGQYTGTITDGNDCKLPISLEVGENAPFDISHGKTDISCFGSNDGKIVVEVLNNTESISYTWTGPGGYTSTEATISDLAAGDYTVAIQEKDGCEVSKEFTLIAPEEVKLTHQKMNVRCFGESTGSIIVSSTGGTAPYTYSIDNGDTYVVNTSFNTLNAGTYTLKVKDANGCTSTEGNNVIEIKEPPAVTIQMDSLFDIVYGETVSLKAIPSIAEAAINTTTWTPEEFLSCSTCLETDAKPEASTTYVLTVVDTMGCEVSKRAIIRVDRSPRVEMPNIFSPNGDRTNDEIGLVTDEVIVQEIEAFLIYDRWGSLVFEVKNAKPNSQELKWDGKTRNKYVESGVYVWVARLVLLDDVKKVYSGDITVIK